MGYRGCPSGMVLCFGRDVTYVALSLPDPPLEVRARLAMAVDEAGELTFDLLPGAAI